VIIFEKKKSIKKGGAGDYPPNLSYLTFFYGNFGG
jgi:hypothetical protein